MGHTRSISSSTERDMFSVTAMGLLARKQALLAAPVVPCDQVPAIAALAALQASSPWPDPVPMNPRKTMRRDSSHPDRFGAIYFGRYRDGVVKVGFSAQLDQRISMLQIETVLLIWGAQRQHERAMHMLLKSCHIDREFFQGERLDRFVAAAVGRAAVRYGELGDARCVALGVRSLGGDPCFEPRKAS